MLKKSLSLPVHFWGLHSQYFFGTARATYSVSPRDVAGGLWAGRGVTARGGKQLFRSETFCIVQWCHMQTGFCLVCKETKTKTKHSLYYKSLIPTFTLVAKLEKRLIWKLGTFKSLAVCNGMFCIIRHIHIIVRCPEIIPYISYAHTYLLLSHNYSIASQKSEYH